MRSLKKRDRRGRRARTGLDKPKRPDALSQARAGSADIRYENNSDKSWLLDAQEFGRANVQAFFQTWLACEIDCAVYPSLQRAEWADAWMGRRQ